MHKIYQYLVMEDSCVSIRHNVCRYIYNSQMKTRFVLGEFFTKEFLIINGQKRKVYGFIETDGPLPEKYLEKYDILQNTEEFKDFTNFEVAYGGM